MSAPYYEDDAATLYYGDCLTETAWLAADVLVMDPPYGIKYRSGRPRLTVAASIDNDVDTSYRDAALEAFDGSALVFGTWRIPRPAGTHTRLIWDTKGALGMGNLAVPWKPSDQEVYVIGYDFEGVRDSNVITCAPVQSLGYNGRLHPHQKPVALMERLIDKCKGRTIADPFAGSGSTLVAAKKLGRKAIGVESDERYCETIATRLQQGALDFEESA